MCSNSQGLCKPLKFTVRYQSHTTLFAARCTETDALKVGDYKSCKSAESFSTHPQTSAESFSAPRPSTHSNIVPWPHWPVWVDLKGRDSSAWMHLLTRLRGQIAPGRCHK